MKQLLISSILLLIISCSNKSANKEAILKILDKQQKDWNTGNMESFMKGYWQSDSLMFIGKNGIKYGWKTTLDNYKKSYPNKTTMGKLEFNILKLEINDKNAYTLGKWSLIRAKDNLNGYFTLYWKKIKGKWLITIDHSS